MSYRITELFAFVAIDEDGDEGIAAFSNNGMMMPMVGADTERVAVLRPIAQKMADRFGIEFRVVRFTVREQIEAIKPRTPR